MKLRNHVAKNLAEKDARFPEQSSDAGLSRTRQPAGSALERELSARMLRIQPNPLLELPQYGCVTALRKSELPEGLSAAEVAPETLMLGGCALFSLAKIQHEGASWGAF